jgi:hypothetical protein
VQGCLEAARPRIGALRRVLNDEVRELRFDFGVDFRAAARPFLFGIVGFKPVCIDLSDVRVHSCSC